MEYIEFLEAVEAGLRVKLGEKIKIDAHELLKNNVRREVMVIQVDQERATPCIPLESLYAMHQLGKSLEEIIDKVVAIVQNNPNLTECDIDKIREWDYAKELVEARIINTKNNREFLSDVPHREFLDCSVVYYVNISDWELGDCHASMKVTNQHLAIWGITLDQLDDCARRNYTERKITFQSMNEVMMELMGAEIGKEEIREVPDNLMYVLSNAERQYGAVVMMDKEMLQFVCKKLDDTFYLIPSSVHELIIIPKKIAMEEKDLKEMVVSVNETLEEEDVLSDSIYYYDGEKVSVVA
ncbi:MAG: DUF5688 family protein [Eubacteriales bacterium]